MLKLTTNKKGTKMKQYERFTNAELKALLKLEHMKQHRDGITNLMFDDWVAEKDANIKRKDKIDSLIKRMPNFNAKEYDYERQR